MRALVLRRFDQPLALEHRADLRPVGEQRLVRVTAAGVCGSDVHIAAGQTSVRLPLVLGHEITGHCQEMGDVLVYAAWGCGGCRHCRSGEEQLCPRGVAAGWEVDGGFAEALLVPSSRYLLPLGGLDPVRAAPLADAGVTSYRAVRHVAPRLGPGTVAVVIGAGGLGQFAIQYVRRLTDSHLIAVEVDDAKRARALDLGADEAVRPDDLDRQVTAVLDFVGTDATLALAARTVQSGGYVVLIGEAGGRLDYHFRALPLEATLMTSVWGSRDDLDTVLRMARNNELLWDVQTLPLERANEALERLRGGAVTGRLVLVP